MCMEYCGVGFNGVVENGENMSELEHLLQKLRDIRVLRSSCSESNVGEFRVHLPEKDWDEIQKLVRELNHD